MRDNSVFNNNVKIISDIPVKELLDIKIDHSIGKHSKLWLKVTIQEETDELLLNAMQGIEIKIFDVEQTNNEPLFSGKTSKVEIYRESQWVFAEIYGISWTYELDQEKKRQSFQNQNSTYEDIIRMVLKGSTARYWCNVKNAVIKNPLIQYDETDWEFLSRLASHFNTYLQVSVTSNNPEFYFGITQRQSFDLKMEMLLEYGFSKDFYEHFNDTRGHFRSDYHYLKLKSKRRWRIGDFTYYKKKKYIVYQEWVEMDGSNLYYYHMLGAPGLLTTNKLYNHKIVGMQLTGVIKVVCEDNLYIQFDIDSENRADYKWEWVPIVNNMGYCMPEIGENVLVLFPEEKEEKGQAIQILSKNVAGPLFGNPDNRGMISNFNKSFALCANKLLLKGQNGLPSIILDDENGILIDSNKGIHYNAVDAITIASEGVQMQAPQKVVLQTTESNIELCRDINLYAPKGVNRNVKVEQSDSIESIENLTEEAVIEEEHWQLSNGAMAAIPSLDLEKMDKKYIPNLIACGTIPKFGQGCSIVAMSEVQEGKMIKDTSFPSSFSSMTNYTLKDGRPLTKQDNTIIG